MTAHAKLQEAFSLVVHNVRELSNEKLSWLMFEVIDEVDNRLVKEHRLDLKPKTSTGDY